VQPELEGGDDAEVAAAAADRPEQVGVLPLAGPHALAVGQHQLGGEQVVDGEAAAAGQVAQAAAKGEAADAGGGDDPARGGQAELAGGPVHLPPGGAAADPDRSALRVDLDVVQRRQVEHDPVVAGAEAGAVVPAAPDGQRQPVPAGEADHLGHGAGVGALGDHRRPLVDHRVVDGAGGVVAGVAPEGQAAVEARQLLMGGPRAVRWWSCLAPRVGVHAWMPTTLGGRGSGQYPGNHGGFRPRAPTP
jgi:hypothetical protein